MNELLHLPPQALSTNILNLYEHNSIRKKWVNGLTHFPSQISGKIKIPFCQMSGMSKIP